VELITSFQAVPKQKFSFDEEPCEYRWIFRRTLEGDLAIKFLEFSDFLGANLMKKEMCYWT